MAPQPPAAAARAPRGGLRRQGDAPHHAAPRRRHRGRGGHGPDARARPAVDRSSRRTRPSRCSTTASRSCRARTGGSTSTRRAPSRGSARLPSMDARAPAFRIQAGPAEITTLPSSSPDDHGSDVSWSIALHADGSADLSGEESAVGDAAFWLRSSLTQADGARRLRPRPPRRALAADSRRREEGRLQGGPAARERVGEVCRARGGARAARAGGARRCRSGRRRGSRRASRRSSRARCRSFCPRTLAPSHQTRTTRFTAPPGFVWAPLPAGGDENGGDFGRAHLEIARDRANPRTMVVKRGLVFDEDVIPAAKYPAWRAWLQRVDRLMHKQVRLIAAK